jgi:hypothetical protein
MFQLAGHALMIHIVLNTVIQSFSRIIYIKLSISGSAIFTWRCVHFMVHGTLDFKDRWTGPVIYSMLHVCSQRSHRKVAL